MVGTGARSVAIALLATGLACLVGLPLVLPRLGTGDGERKDEARLTQRSGASIKLGARLAELYGIRAQTVRYTLESTT